MSCSSNNYAVDTVCEFGCNYGYKLIGSKKRMCLPISLWAGLPAYCKREYLNITLTLFGSDRSSRCHVCMYVCVCDFPLKPAYQMLESIRVGAMFIN